MSAPAGRFDLVVIGSGPAGRRAAVEATRLGARTALVERRPALGGTVTEAGILPFRTLRAAAIDAAAAARGRYLRPGGDGREVTVADLLWRADRVVEAERDAISDQLRHEHVEVVSGSATFIGPDALEVHSPHGRTTVTAERFVIAVGTAPRRPAEVDFDDRSVVAADGMVRLHEVPRRLTVVGAGISGLEAASVATALGVAVTLIDRAHDHADELDHEIRDALVYHLRGLGVTVRLGEEVRSVGRPAPGVAVTHLASGEAIRSDAVIYAAGREGATRDLALAAAGLRADARGLIPVDDSLRTAVPHIFAAGDVVVGARGRAVEAMDQGRRAALAALGRPAPASRAPLPLGVSTIPEIASVGPNEQDLVRAGRPVVRGVARFGDLVRGEMSGERTGLLKLLVDPRTRRVLAVHIFGASSMELVHVGQAVIASGMTLDYLVDAVPDVASFAEAYAVAARDASARMRHGEHRRCEVPAAARTLAS